MVDAINGVSHATPALVSQGQGNVQNQEDSSETLELSQTPPEDQFDRQDHLGLLTCIRPEDFNPETATTPERVSALLCRLGETSDFFTTIPGENGDTYTFIVNDTEDTLGRSIGSEPSGNPPEYRLMYKTSNGQLGFFDFDESGNLLQIDYVANGELEATTHETPGQVADAPGTMKPFVNPELYTEAEIEAIVHEHLSQALQLDIEKQPRGILGNLGEAWQRIRKIWIGS